MIGNEEVQEHGKIGQNQGEGSGLQQPVTEPLYSGGKRARWNVIVVVIAVLVALAAIAYIYVGGSGGAQARNAPLAFLLASNSMNSSAFVMMINDGANLTSEFRAEYQSLSVSGAQGYNAPSIANSRFIYTVERQNVTIYTISSNTPTPNRPTSATAQNGHLTSYFGANRTADICSTELHAVGNLSLSSLQTYNCNRLVLPGGLNLSTMLLGGERAQIDGLNFSNLGEREFDAQDCTMFSGNRMTVTSGKKETLTVAACLSDLYYVPLNLTINDTVSPGISSIKTFRAIYIGTNVPS